MKKIIFMEKMFDKCGGGALCGKQNVNKERALLKTKRES